MRLTYKKITQSLLWEDDINVEILGKRNTTLQFTGRAFTTNKNIKEVQNSCSDMVNKLRFKTINYKWYKYDDEYTYFTLDTPKDSDLI